MFVCFSLSLLFYLRSLTQEPIEMQFSFEVFGMTLLKLVAESSFQEVVILASFQEVVAGDGGLHLVSVEELTVGASLHFFKRSFLWTLALLLGFDLGHEVFDSAGGGRTLVGMGQFVDEYWFVSALSG